MNVEHSLAAKEIARLGILGFGPTACIVAATQLLQSQGFCKAYAMQVARQMAQLVL